MFKKAIHIILVVAFFTTTLTPVSKAHANELLGLPVPGTMVSLSPAYAPVMIKGLTVHKDNPFLFDFIVDVGQDKAQGEALKAEGNKLIKYFLASLTLPEKDIWVNLSPYEKDRTISKELAKTDMGRDLLAQDYILKQITASLIYPEKDLGRKFWDKVYAKAQQMYGTTEVPVNTFNKVWIMADKAEVFEHGQTAFVTDSHLKVMLEEDYLALNKHTAISKTPNDAKAHAISSQIVKAIIIPELEKEVNTGKNFAQLRQVFNSLILAAWYKKNLKNALLNQVYSNKSTTQGINLKDPTVKDQIYQRYLQAYKKGVFNYIKEDIDQAKGTTTPRKYFSGGVSPHVTERLTLTEDPAQLVMALGSNPHLVDMAVVAEIDKPVFVPTNESQDPLDGIAQRLANPAPLGVAYKNAIDGVLDRTIDALIAQDPRDPRIVRARELKAEAASKVYQPRPRRNFRFSLIAQAVVLSAVAIALGIDHVRDNRIRVDERRQQILENAGSVKAAPRVHLLNIEQRKSGSSADGNVYVVSIFFGNTAITPNDLKVAFADKLTFYRVQRFSPNIGPDQFGDYVDVGDTQRIPTNVVAQATVHANQLSFVSFAVGVWKSFDATGESMLPALIGNHDDPQEPSPNHNQFHSQAMTAIGRSEFHIMGRVEAYTKDDEVITKELAYVKAAVGSMLFGKGLWMANALIKAIPLMTPKNTHTYAVYGAYMGALSIAGIGLLAWTWKEDVGIHTRKKMKASVGKAVKNFGWTAAPVAYAVQALTDYPIAAKWILGIAVATAATAGTMQIAGTLKSKRIRQRSVVPQKDVFAALELAIEQYRHNRSNIIMLDRLLESMNATLNTFDDKIEGSQYILSKLPADVMTDAQLSLWIKPLSTNLDMRRHVSPSASKPVVVTDQEMNDRLTASSRSASEAMDRLLAEQQVKDAPSVGVELPMLDELLPPQGQQKTVDGSNARTMAKIDAILASGRFPAVNNAPIKLDYLLMARSRNKPVANADHVASLKEIGDVELSWDIFLMDSLAHVRASNALRVSADLPVTGHVLGEVGQMDLLIPNLIDSRPREVTPFDAMDIVEPQQAVQESSDELDALTQEDELEGIDILQGLSTYEKVISEGYINLSANASVRERHIIEALVREYGFPKSDLDIAADGRILGIYDGTKTAHFKLWLKEKQASLLKAMRTKSFKYAVDEYLNNSNNEILVVSGLANDLRKSLDALMKSFDKRGEAQLYIKNQLPPQVAQSEELATLFKKWIRISANRRFSPNTIVSARNKISTKERSVVIGDALDKVNKGVNVLPNPSDSRAAIFRAIMEEAGFPQTAIQDPQSSKKGVSALSEWLEDALVVNTIDRMLEAMPQDIRNRIVGVNVRVHEGASTTRVVVAPSPYEETARGRFLAGVGADAAMKVNKSAVDGGIDLDAGSIAWKVRKDGHGVEMAIDPAMIARIKRDGIGSLTPVIFRVTPILNVWSLIGLTPPAREERLAAV